MNAAYKPNARQKHNTRLRLLTEPQKRLLAESQPRVLAQPPDMKPRQSGTALTGDKIKRRERGARELKRNRKEKKGNGKNIGNTKDLAGVTEDVTVLKSASHISSSLAPNSYEHNDTSTHNYI